MKHGYNQVNLTFHTPREVRRSFRKMRYEIEPFDIVVNALAQRVRRYALYTTEEMQVLAQCQLGIECDLLRYDADHPPDSPHLATHVQPAYLHLAGVIWAQAAKHGEYRRLTCTVGAE